MVMAPTTGYRRRSQARALLTSLSLRQAGKMTSYWVELHGPSITTTGPPRPRPGQGRDRSTGTAPRRGVLVIGTGSTCSPTQIAIYLPGDRTPRDTCTPFFITTVT